MVKNKKFFLYIFFTAFILLIPSLTIANPSTTSSKTKWTLMMYCAADNHRDLEINYTLKFLSDIGSNIDFNIVALVDTRTLEDTHYYYIEKNKIDTLTWYENESNMAEPKTFEEFLKRTMNNYSADHYALFIITAWGSGWQGIISDTNGTDKGRSLSLMTMPQMSEVLKKVTSNGLNKIDFLGDDVCISGMAEVAYQIAPYVEYMTASEEHGFGLGEFSDDGRPMEWNYSYFLQELNKNPDMSPEQFAKSVVESYHAGIITSKIFLNIKAPKLYPIVKFYTTLSATNLNNISNMSNSVNLLGTLLKDNISKYRNEIRKARSETREYGKLYRKFWFQPCRTRIVFLFDPLGYDCFIDLYDFAEKLRNTTVGIEIKGACGQVMNAINTTVIANEAVPTDPSHGLSIYFPQLKCQYDQSIWKGMGNKNFIKIPSPYENLSFSKDTMWDEFLRAYLKV